MSDDALKAAAECFASEHRNACYPDAMDFEAEEAAGRIVAAYKQAQMEGKFSPSQAAEARVSVPEGWKLVPVKMTDDMSDAFREELIVIQEIGVDADKNEAVCYDLQRVEQGWAAALASSPDAPQGASVSPRVAESFWVIEQFKNGKSLGYWCGGSSRTFDCCDIDRAVQFRRREDALAIAASWHWSDVQLTEHVMLSAAPSSPVSRLIAGETEALATLTPDLAAILGRPNFSCIRIAELLRLNGYDIPRKSEAEQAAVIHWLLGLFLKFGADWRKEADERIDALTRLCKSEERPEQEGQP